MRPEDVLRCLATPGTLLCRDLNEESAKRYGVPVTAAYYEDVAEPDRSPLDSIGDGLVATQLRALYAEHEGLGLFAPEKLDLGSLESGSIEFQHAFGAIVIIPVAEWKHLKARFIDWQYDGLEQAFEGLPYGIDDIEFFAMRNFSPDSWFLVTRGPMAGSICLWGHDGDNVMDEPWAMDMREWEKRIMSNIEDAFGGVIRYGAHLADVREGEDGPPEDAELYPVEYVEWAEAESTRPRRTVKWQTLAL